MSQHCDLILVLLQVLDVKMSKDGINLKETSLAKVKCLCHIVIGCKSTPRPFSLNSWTKVRDAAIIRDDHIHAKYKDLLATDHYTGKYHHECYARYTNPDHLE